ncbi:MAG: hypothetical protein Q8P59_10075, partial [Dehalococcoidia bacterium]|nr:hypothetical protein [Dehalococcoidia bacterium]
SLLYRAYAALGDPRLPTGYQRNVIDLDGLTSLAKEVLLGEKQLSPETMEQLRPFLLRPNDQGSIFAQRPSSKASSAALHGLASPLQADNQWNSVTILEGQVRLWWFPDPMMDEGDLGVEWQSALATVTEAFEGVYGKLVDLMGDPVGDEAGVPSKDTNPDSAIDVYLMAKWRLLLGGVDPRKSGTSVDLLATGGGAATIAPPFEGGKCSGYITMLVWREKFSSFRPHVWAAVTHELFHVLQNARACLLADRWLSEATAVWAEDFALDERGLDTEMKHLGGFHDSFYNSWGEHGLLQISPYSAYLYFTFAAQEMGDSVVRSVWDYMEQHPGANPLEAVDKVFPFRIHFRKFALQAYNAKPVSPLFGDSDPEFWDGDRPEFRKETLLRAGETVEVEEFLEALQAIYVPFEVPQDGSVKKVVFRLEGAAEDPDVGVDAIVTIKGREPEVRHWSDKSKVTFCLDDENEKLQRLILIVSNAKLDANFVQITVEPSKTCQREGPPKLSGYITYSEEWKEPAPWLGFGGQAEFRFPGGQGEWIAGQEAWLAGQGAWTAGQGTWAPGQGTWTGQQDWGYGPCGLFSRANVYESYSGGGTAVLLIADQNNPPPGPSSLLKGG